MDKNNTLAGVSSDTLLPNFCTNQTVLTAMLIAELLAIVLTVGTGQWNINALTYLAYASLFVQWITLCDIALLCWARKLYRRLSPPWMLAAIYLSLQVVTLVISELGYRIVSSELIAFPQGDYFHWELLGGNLIVSMIVTAVAMRYFFLQRQSLNRMQAENEARIEALQARIRPHFLFNSMNTIANLIHADPDRAEDAILDLSELFRSSLGKQDFVSISEEIAITRRYTNIEQLRLGERLQIDWEVPAILPTMDMPALMLQPLVENAIYHGIEPEHTGGRISVSVRKADDCIEMVVDNPVPKNIPERRSKGNQVALNNIRQRLALAYGGRGTMEIEHSDERHRVTLCLPLTTPTKEEQP
ncbi:MAG: sensor histidine kinase [Pseudomonadota bacterium]